MLFTNKKMLAILDRWKRVPKLAPVEIDGEKFYVVIVHPRNYYLLKVVHAREKYKHEQWVIRYNRWRLSRGEPPYQEIEAEVGELNEHYFTEVA